LEEVTDVTLDHEECEETTLFILDIPLDGCG
jgi:hypothetical protein